MSELAVIETRISVLYNFLQLLNFFLSHPFTHEGEDKGGRWEQQPPGVVGLGAHGPVVGIGEPL